jgi:phosphoglycolate phosphatase
MDFKGIIFDLDGTLADTGGDLSCSINLMLESFGFERMGMEDILLHINYGARAFVSGCLPEKIKKNADFEEFLDLALNRYKAFYAEHFCEKTRLYGGIAELVAALHENGVKMCVLSNKQDDMTKKIVTSLLDQKYFVEILGGSEKFPHKPEPDSALYLAEKMESEPDGILYIGDSDVDMKTALNANMFPLGVSWGYRPESVLIMAGAKKTADDPIEILKLVGGI